MRIKLITQEDYDMLIDTYEKYPELSLQNKGYEGIDKSKLSLEAITRNEVVNCILRKSIVGFVKFQNFKKDKDGNPQIRLQYDWGWEGKTIHFTGVGYILIDELLNGFKEESNEKS